MECHCHLMYFYAAAILLAVYLFFKWKFSYWKNRGVPTLPPQIPFGNIRFPESRHLKDICAEAYDALKKKAPIAGLYFLFSPVAVVTDLELIKTILIKNFSDFHDRKVFYNEKDDPLSAHMFSASGEKWRSLRHKLTPTFTSGKMKYMFPTVVDICNEFVDTLRQAIQIGNEIEVKEYLSRFTTDVIGRCAFGIDCNSLKDPNAEFRNYGRKIFTKLRHSQFVIQMMQQFPNLARKLHMKFIRDDISNFFMRVVRETIDYREANNVKRNDFMDLLIELKNSKDGLSFEEVAAQAFVFFIAGFETSSTLLTYTLYELALNQDVQEKAREDVLQVLRKNNGNLSYDAMTEMRYIDQVLNESLRKYPPVPLLIRCANRDFQIPGTKIVLEKDTKLFIPTYSIHHDPAIFPNPEVFDPSRFDPEEEQKRDSLSFLAFGDGPRNCVGLRFGKMQSRIGLINLLKNFNIKMSSKTPVKLEFNNALPLLATKGGMHLRFEERSK